jgi:hypothetical protein
MKRMHEQAPRAAAMLHVGSGAIPGLETMRANTARSLRPTAPGLTLRCVSGLVVVTQKGDRDDHELGPGEEFRTSRRGLVVAWAILDSRFMVMTDAEADQTRRAA